MLPCYHILVHMQIDSPARTFDLFRIRTFGRF